MRPTSERCFRVVKVPTLIVAETDHPLRTPRAEYVASLIPGAKSFSVPGNIHSEESTRAVVDAIRRFVGVDRTPIELETVLATVLFTDIVGSTERQAALGDHEWKQLAERHHAIVRAALARWRGFENDTAGDGFYATFDGPARAIRCGLEIAERVRDLGIEVRAGVHTGECELIDRKHAGITVSIGARIATRLRAVRGPRFSDREGPRRGERARLRGCRRSRAERCTRPLAPLPGDRVGSCRSLGP